jgi:UDP-N-acetylmuramate dehydrogenase
MNQACEIAGNIIAALQNAGFRGSVASDAPLAPFTSYGIGGPASLLVELQSVENLIIFKQVVHEHNFPILILGAGTNILFSDDGFQGAVARLAGEFTEMTTVDDIIRAGAAVPVARIVREGARIGLEGIARLAGIPGWIGGAIVMNAGTFGEHIDGLLKDIDILSVDNLVLNLAPDRCAFGYRTSRFLNSREVVLGCSIAGPVGIPDLVAAVVRNRLERRKETQPVDLPSCGCVFKNPPGERSAAKLIEETGLKGTRRGGASISSKHANYIVNEGGARAIDIIELMALAREKVRERFNLTLMPEVRTYGFPAPLEVMLDASRGSSGSHTDA